MLKSLKGYRTYLALAATFVVAVNDAVQAIPLDQGVETAVMGALLALAALARRFSKPR